MRWNFRIQSTKIQILKITFCKPILLRLYTCLPASPIKHALTKKTNYFYVVGAQEKEGMTTKTNFTDILSLKQLGSERSSIAPCYHIMKWLHFLVN